MALPNENTNENTSDKTTANNATNASNAGGSNANNAAGSNTNNAGGNKPDANATKNKSKAVANRTVKMRAISTVDQLDEFGDRVSTGPGGLFLAEKDEAKRLREAGVAQYASESSDDESNED